MEPKIKVKVSICMGTACFVMGASELLLLEEKVPENLKDKVELELEGITCFEACRDDSMGKPPFVKVNGELISQANVMTVLDKISQIAGV